MEAPTATLTEKIFETLKRQAALNPDKPALIDSSDSTSNLTCSQLLQGALSTASFLKSCSFSTGDRVTMIIPNCVEFPMLHLGVWAARGVIIGSSTHFKHYERKQQLEATQSSFVFTTEELLQDVMEVVNECPFVKIVVCIRNSTKTLPHGVVDFNDVKTFPHSQNELEAGSLDDEASIFHSSGTTGTPKGAIQTQRTFHSAMMQIMRHWEQEIYPHLGVAEVDWSKEYQVSQVPGSHAMGFTLLNWFLLAGSPIVIVKSQNAELFVAAVEKFKPSSLVLHPAMIVYLLKNRLTLSSVQLILISGSFLRAELAEEFLVRNTSVKYLVQGYGMTEVNFCHLPRLRHTGFTPSVGAVTALYEQKIVDVETQLPLGPGEKGEICVRGAPMMIGYLNNPELTRQTIDVDGWFHTGDLGYVDNNGDLHIVDRIKDLIKVYYNGNTQQTSPTEIERVLTTHPKIRDVAVAGIPDEENDMTIRAFVVRTDDSLTAEDVKKTVADTLSAFKQLSGGVRFVDSIPRSELGKIQRNILRTM